ncbi:MAG: polyprenyl synthetase family protein [Bacteroidales bacterium]
MDNLNEIKQCVAEELLKFEQQLVDSLRVDSDLLNSAVSYFLKRKGKNLRPLLVLLAAKCVSGIVKKQTICGAISLELLHSASIIHDDVVDETLQRRGMSSMNAAFSNKIAVLVGDFFLSTSLTNATDTSNLEIMQVIARIGRELAAGEIEQLSLASSTEISEERYMSVIMQKTASLFVACMQVGALSVVATPEQLENLSRFGHNLGLCFQIKDDIFDYFDDPAIGKPTGNDIREGKITLPLIYAIQNSPLESEVEEAREMIRVGEYSPETVAYLIDFAKRSGGIEYAEKVMESFKDEAIAALDCFASSPAKSALLKLLEFVIDRNH